MQRRFSLAFVMVTAVIALTFGTLAGGVAGGFAAWVLVPSSETVDDGSASDTPAAIQTNPTPTPTLSPDPPSELDDTDAADVDEDGDMALSTGYREDIADIVERASPAVVTVINQQAMPEFFEGSEEPERAGSGTGFIVDTDGHIVTNNHVVLDSDEILVIFSDGSEAEATVVGSDEFADIAVLKVDTEVPGVLGLGDSMALRPGERVIAIGSALGDYTNTVTEGIVSGLNRNLQTNDGFNMEDMIQHSASINPGNSGGPLLNMDGEVVGVNTAVVRRAGPGVTAEGLGFAIPSNTVTDLSEDLIASGDVDRPYLGIVYQPLTTREARASDVPVESGVVVQEVEPGTPADDAGIRADDIITKIDGLQINDENPLVNLLFTFNVGDTVDVEIYRASSEETLTLQLTLGIRP